METLALPLILALAVFLALIVVILILLLKVLKENRDITTRKDAELRFREDLFSTFTERTNDIILVISADADTIEFVSPNIERILGVTPEETKADLYSIQPPTYTDGTPPTREELLAVMEDGFSVRESTRTHKTTGETLTFQETTYYMVRDGIGHFVAILSDRTDEKNKRMALEEALKSSLAASQAKSAFLSNVSHDIRTPMNAIVGLSDLLESHTDDPAFIKENISKIQVSSRHLLSLLNDVLDMSKIESGNAVLNLDEFHLSDVIDEVERVIGAQADAKGQRLDIEVEPSVPASFTGDKVRVAQVLMNILSNSVKYTQEGGHISLSVSCPGTMHSNGEMADVRFVVVDDGIGMSEEFVERIFEPFAREDQSIVSEMQGTGLGMPIAKSLVDLMGGDIIVESVVGKGSRFVVDIALRVHDSIPQQEVAREMADLSGMHFLVAEDIEINAEVLSELLRTQDSTCEVAENGEVAVRMFAESPERTYDAILMDVQMPVMNGYEATREIRACGRGDATTVPIVAMTANAFTEDVNNAIASGMDAHIAKPARMSQLRETLGSVMAKRAAGSDKAGYAAGKDEPCPLTPLR